MRDVFVDPSVLLLAIGGEHPLKASSRDLLSAAARGELRLHLSVKGGQEFLFHRTRRVGAAAAAREFDALDMSVVWHDFTIDVLRVARDLVARGDVRGRDAVHAATAMGAGFAAIVSADSDFDGIPGLARHDPASGELRRPRGA